MTPTNTELNAILKERIDGVLLADYAENLATRERYLDEGKITKGWFGGYKGDTDWVMTMFEGFARRHKVPYLAGDFDRSNKVAGWDARIQSDPATRAAWCEVYAAALVKMCNHDPNSAQGNAIVERLKRDDAMMMNPFSPISKRKAKISTALKQQKDQALLDAFQGVQATADVQPAAQTDDAVIFPGERLSKLSDFVRLQKAAQSGDFMGALAREGVDPGYYGQMSIKWANLVQSDPMLAARYARMLQQA